MIQNKNFVSKQGQKRQFLDLFWSYARYGPVFAVCCVWIRFISLDYIISSYCCSTESKKLYCIAKIFSNFWFNNANCVRFAMDIHANFEYSYHSDLHLYVVNPVICSFWDSLWIIMVNPRFCKLGVTSYYLKSRASFKCIMHVASLGGRNSVSTHTVWLSTIGSTGKYRIQINQCG